MKGDTFCNTAGTIRTVYPELVILTAGGIHVGVQLGTAIEILIQDVEHKTEYVL